MAQLQEPKYVYMGAALRPWKEATLHIGTEAVTRSLNVFEGLKGYWREDGGSFGIVQLRQHYERLRRSARLLRMPFDVTYDGFQAALTMLLDELLEPDQDMWFRTTLYAVEGHWGEGTVADLVIVGFQHPKKRPDPVRIGVSTWRRSPDVSLPARIKTGTNYQVARLARMEGHDRGWDEMVLLNDAGRVAEATGSCIVVARDGVLCTPPPSEGALESITLDIVEALAGSLGIPFVRRPIDRTELLIADEIALCGTLAEMVVVTAVEGQPMPADAPLMKALQDRYFSAVRNVEPHPFVESTVLGSRAHGQRGDAA